MLGDSVLYSVKAGPKKGPLRLTADIFKMPTPTYMIFDNIRCHTRYLHFHQRNNNVATPGESQRSGLLFVTRAQQ